MTDLTALLEIIGTIALVAVPIVVLSWLSDGSDGPGLAVIFAIPVDPPLPRRVQEGEPVRFRVERLTRPEPRPAASARPARAARAAVDTGPCA